MTTKMRLISILCFGLCLFMSLVFSQEDPSNQELSQPIYQIKSQFNVSIPMRDGILLSTDIYRPDAEGRFPVLLTRTYYGKCRHDIFHDDDNLGACSSKEFIEYFVPRGYVVVIQDCRGRFDSEGEFYPEIYDAEDGYDTCNWCGTQPWSNGKIGTFGCSYGGGIQWYPAHLNNPYLKCMVPRDAQSNPYFDGGFVRGGVYQQGLLPSSISNAGRTMRSGVGNSVDWEEIFLTLPLNKAVESIGFNIPWLNDYFKHPTYDDFWKRTSIHEKYHMIGVPALNIGGWHSISDIMGTIRNFLGVFKKGRTTEARKSQRLLIGPWRHCSSPTRVHEMEFGPKAMVNFNELQLRWFDYWLKGIDTGIMSTPPIKIFVMGMNDWIYANDWPLPNTQFSNFYFHSNGRANSLIGDGILSTVAPASEPQDYFTYDPSNPVPALRNVGLDQRPIERRDDVLVFTTEPLEEDLIVIGPVKVILYAASSAKDTDFTGKLVDVHLNDMARILCSGIVRARYRDSYEKPSLIEPGKIYEYEIDLWATGNMFKTGHRIRVEISSSHFPYFLPNTNTGNDIGSDTERKIARQTIYHDAKHPSRIVLPVIPKNDKAGKTV